MFKGASPPIFGGIAPASSQSLSSIVCDNKLLRL